MKVHDIIKRKGSSISFEFFPPKDEAGEAKLMAGAVKQLAALHPDFVSVTYGAGGGTRKTTGRLVKRIKEETSLEPMPHLTCVDQSQDELLAILEEYRSRGIENILALRGDPPKGTGEFVAPEGGFCYARDLVSLVASMRSFCIGVACYPEGHLEAPSLEMDLFYTKAKIDAGAHFAITQMFFDNRRFYEFLDRARQAGITVPIIPGIMPLLDIKKVGDFCDKCGATMPVTLAASVEGKPPEESRKIGLEYTIEQCADLLRNGIHSFHFYTMNQAEAVTEIYRTLKLDKL